MIVRYLVGSPELVSRFILPVANLNRNPGELKL